jgi:methionyl-tRNA formyltransferase
MHLTPSPVKKFALEKGLNVLTPESIKDEEALRQVANLKAEAAVVVAYGQIVPQKFLDLFAGKVVNVHGSVLPRWRGAAPIQRAIQHGDQITGVSLQVMVKKLDAGPVLGSYELDIQPEWDALRLHDELKPLGARLLHVELMDFLRGHLIPMPQDESLVTYAALIDKSESKIDFAKSAMAISNQIRAFVLGPGSFGLLNGQPLKIWKAEPIEVSKEAPAGQVIRVEADFFTVACGGGALKVHEVQPASRPRMSCHDFLLGHKLKVGDALS